MARISAIVVGVGLVGTSAVLCDNSTSPADKDSSTSRIESDSEFVDISSLQKWDSNWDGRLVTWFLIKWNFWIKKVDFFPLQNAQTWNP